MTAQPCGRGGCPGLLKQRSPGRFFRCATCGRLEHTALCFDAGALLAGLSCCCGLSELEERA